MRFKNEKEVSRMAKKLKKAKKGMNPKVKFTLVNSFKGLVSNQAVIDGSKNSPWWVAVIFLVFSVIIPLIPIFVQLSSADASSFIATYNYGLDEQLAHFAYQMKKDNVEFMVEGGKLHYYKDGNEVPSGFVNPNDDPEYFIKRKYEAEYTNTENHQFEVKFYFWTDNNLIENVNKILTQSYKVYDPTSTDPENGKLLPEGTAGEKIYMPNIVVLTPTTMAVQLYKSNTNTIANTSYGGLDWMNSPNKGLVERLLGEHAEKVNTLSEIEFVNQYKADVIKTFKVICIETYVNQKSKTKWSNTGIYAGIYAGVIMFLGLMVFILTRGKNNPYKYLNVWDCQKISWWGAASPAIIGTVLSLIFGGNAIGQMAFILVVSLRIMWLSMKQLRPVYQQ